MLAVLDPGDEVVVFEPFYENYGPTRSSPAPIPRYVTLHEPDWTFDPDELRAAFNAADARRSSLNTPEQPDGQGLHARRSSS